MEYLFILGPSGSGKTNLAKNLQKFNSKYKWLTQTTTRPTRLNEKEGREYYFLSEEDYAFLDSHEDLICQVKKEFAPYSYGTPICDLDETKINIIVACIEGFLDSLTKVKEADTISVLFINNVKPEIERDARSFHDEEKYNKIVLEKVQDIYQGTFKLIEISHENLKKIRNNKRLLLEFMEEKWKK